MDYCINKYDKYGLPINYKIKTDHLFEELKCLAKNKIFYVVYKRQYYDLSDEIKNFIKKNNFKIFECESYKTGSKYIRYFNKNSDLKEIYKVIILMGDKIKINKKFLAYYNLILSGISTQSIINYFIYVYINEYKFPKTIVSKMFNESRNDEGQISLYKLHMLKYNYLKDKLKLERLKIKHNIKKSQEFLNSLDTNPIFLNEFEKFKLGIEKQDEAANKLAAEKSKKRKINKKI